MIDFDALADLNNTKSPNPEDIRNLWTAFFKLEEWIFVVDASVVSENPPPFVGFIDEKPWLFIFTDTQRAYDFAKEHQLLDKKGECLFIATQTSTALKMLINTQSAIEGIRVNEGPHGWFCPLDNIVRIHTLLHDEGLL